jgi:membrane-associated phospholipid phosphatase
VSAGTLAPPRRRTPRRVRPRLIGELVVVAVLLRVYDLIKSLADRKAAEGLHNAGRVRALERTLHLDWERSLNRFTTHHHVLDLICVYWYQFAHETITITVLALCWWFRPHAYRSARNALVAINVVGLTVFALFPVAPPRLLPGAGFVDSVAAAGFGTSHGGPVMADQFAAMPSLHLAWATWTAVLLYRWTRRPLLRALCVLYPMWMVVVVVGTANHYVLDAIAGVATAALCIAATGMAGPRAAAVRDRPVALEQPARQAGRTSLLCSRVSTADARRSRRRSRTPWASLDSPASRQARRNRSSSSSRWAGLPPM